MSARLGIVVPCYNEAERLSLDAFRKAIADQPAVHFIFVDDGSRDRTRSLLQTFVSEFPGRCQLVALERNRGKAEAVRQGLLQGIAEGFACVGYWDADLATPLDVISKFAAVLEETGKNFVIGSRTRLLGHRIDRQGLRHYVGRIFATFAGITLHTAIYDTQCGAKLFRVDDALRTALGEPFHTKWCFDVELCLRLADIGAAQGLDLQDIGLEYPLNHWTHVEGSKLSLKNAPQILGEMLYLAKLGLGQRKRAKR